MSDVSMAAMDRADERERLTAGAKAQQQLMQQQLKSASARGNRDRRKDLMVGDNKECRSVSV